MTSPDAIDRARAAFDRHAWTEAYEMYLAADGETPLSAADLEHAGLAAHLLGSEVDALHQTAGINPLFPRVPALNAGGIEQILPHIAALQGDLAQAQLRKGEVFDHPYGPDDQLHRAFDLGKIGTFGAEEIGPEERAQHRTHVIL